MKNLNQISDVELLSLVKTKVETERQLTLEVIDLLHEVQSRRLHLKRGYSSLHEFCVKELKYSDGSAYRRIKAMKLVSEIPEAKESLEMGRLNLTTASQLQSAFEAKAKEQKPMTVAEKKELVNLVQNQSKREVERTLAKLCPEVVHTFEKVRPINESQVKVELVIESELLKKIEKLKALTSHKNKNLVELLEDLVDQELRRRDPELRAPASKTVKKIKTASPENSQVASPEKTNIIHKHTRYIPSTVKHYVWMRDKGHCTYTDPLTGRTCESKHKVTYEHIQPFAMGGENTAYNLRLLCANHNGLTAINVFGKQKVEGFRSAGAVKP